MKKFVSLRKEWLEVNLFHFRQLFTGPRMSSRTVTRNMHQTTCRARPKLI